MSYLDGHDVLGPDAEHDPRGIDDIEGVGALGVLRRAKAASPELQTGLGLTVLMALAVAGGNLLVPETIHWVLDLGILADGVRMGRVVLLSSISILLVGGSILLGKATYYRLLRTMENLLMGLRVQTFTHLHRLSLAEHTASRKGALVARVTSDVETLTQFVAWGALSWIINPAQILGVLVVMATYSWQLLLVTLLVHLPLVPVLRWMQRRQLRAYDQVRTRVSDTLSVVSESLQGVDVVRAYGYREATRSRLHGTIDRQYRQQMRAQRYFSLVLPLTDITGIAAIAAVIGVGVHWGGDWGVTSGELVAFVFLSNLFVARTTELGEVLDQTQTALAGWWKILDVLDIEVDLVEPVAGPPVPAGALSVRAEGVEFAYRGGDRVLHGLDVDLPAGAAVAVVGETGSGKTTFAKLLARLVDPTAGRVLIGGVDLTLMAVDDRHRAVRMVPQDGFLFNTTVADNIGYGRPDARRVDVEAAIDSLGLRWWVDRLPFGMDTPVGERGESLSVGERQLVALARAQVADPGLLILDEATSAIDPEMERALEGALQHLAEGRTTVSVAHRLTTAEQADRILVFDRGRIVEQGGHTDLVAADGVYTALYQSWLGNTRVAPR